MNDRRWRLAVGGFTVLGALIALVVKYHLFPQLSINHDEGVYLQQAEMLLAGQLVLDPPVPDAFRPWFFVDSGSVLYPKYTPIPAVVYAVAELVTGAYVAALPVVAGGIVALTMVVGAQVFDRVTGVIAGGLVMGSPLFLVQAGVFLPYAPTLLFELGFVVCYFHALRTGQRWPAVGAGLCIGTAFFARPYTAVLFGLPFIGYTLVRLGVTRDRDQFLTQSLVVAAGGLGGVVVTLAYNWVLTGSPLLFPYQAFAPFDGVGFGTRRLLGYERYYDLALALRSNFVGLRLFATQWVVGGILGTALALGGLAMALVRVDRPIEVGAYHPVHGQLLLGGVGLAVILGNIPFWGTLNSLGNLSDPNGIATLLGPYYHFDLLVPTTVFGAYALRRGWPWLATTVSNRVEPVPTAAVFVVGVLVTGLLLGGVTVAVAEDAYSRNIGVRDAYADAYAPFQSSPPDDAVVFIPQPYGPWLNHPFQHLRNTPGFDGSLVYALRETNPFQVVGEYPDRSLYRYVYRGPWSPMTGASITAGLRPVETRTASRIAMPVRFGVPAAYESVSVLLTTTDSQAAYAVDWNGSTAGFTLSLTRQGASITGDAITQVSGPQTLPFQDRDLTVVVFLDTGTGAGLTYRLDIPVRSTGERVQVMTPYREMCVDPRQCGGAAAAIPDTLPAGLFLTTSFNTTTDTVSPQPFLDTHAEN